MSRLISRLPPLKALLAFEAVGRLGTVTRAAQELGSTQPAVSHQLKNLEQFLGIQLFNRTSRTLVLTHQGRDYHEAVSEHLSGLARSTDQLRITADKTVEILSHPAFISLCLMPLTEEIRHALPDINIKLTAREVFNRQELERADIVIEYGKADPSLNPLLFSESVVPVASPSFITQHKLPASELSPDSLNRLPLLELDDGSFWMSWQQWREKKLIEANPERISIFSNYALVVEGARNGQGIALGFTGLIRDLLEQGQLIPLGAPIQVPDYGYNLRLNSPDDHSSVRLREWLKGYFSA
ncbi:MAG: LysR family transcriptional regulator [Amphritea sp.]|nr:LysR family transcriptional regulator [Amphritea sp.]